MSNVKWLNVGSILKSKKGISYIKIDQDVSLKKDDVLFLKNKQEDIKEQVERGTITEERGQELLEKLHFIKFNILLKQEQQ